MTRDELPNRRQIVAAGITSVAALAATPAFAQQPLNPDAGVTAPEDLMKEHGVLNRCLLIYEEGIRRIKHSEEVSPAVFHHTAMLVRKFVEQYHEKNEEKYIFPVFDKHGKLVDLVDTLKAQHKAGRKLTETVITLSKPETFHAKQHRDQIVHSVEAFIRMYRPHEAREDTVLFPALRTLLTPKQVESLGERMEEDEHKVLGDEGFEKCVAEVESIEKTLGIYDLKQFTPHV